MKTNLMVLGVILGVSGLWIPSSKGGPSLPVTRPPVQPAFLMTGPPIDPLAAQGQWFRDPHGAEEVRSHEFYDDLFGGFMGSAAITGHVSSIAYQMGPGSPILAFSILATLWNDTTPMAEWIGGDNSHGEHLQYQEASYVGTLYDVKLTAEFAITDAQNLPASWLFPYRERMAFIEALNEDQAAWYCWSPESQEAPTGGYFVPTWDFGDIPAGQSATRKLDFSIPMGLPNFDPRYQVIEQSWLLGEDVLLNRTSSLKISTWIDEITRDNGTPYPIPQEGPYRSSDVSVFHNMEPEPEDGLDFGDAPDPTYPTLLVNNGARHIIVPGIFMGALIDGEPDGQPHPNALGDDLNNLPDEDGVAFMTSLIPGQSAQVNVTVSVPGNLSAWIDFNGNGSWADVGDQIFAMQPVSAGLNALTFPAPASAVPGATFARFRFTTFPFVLSYTGLAEDGEVEDYEVVIEEKIKDYDFGDAPEGVLAYPATGVFGSFPTCASVGGPGSWIQHTQGTARFGAGWDAEVDGNAGFCPLFNPNTYDQDECFADLDAGLMLPDAFTIVGPAGAEVVQPCPGAMGSSLGAPCEIAVWGVNVDIMVNNNLPQAFVNVLMDWNQDGVWSGVSGGCPGGPAPEHVLINFPVPTGAGTLSAMLPPPFLIGPQGGYVWTRFTITDQPVPLPWNGAGVFDVGETEDYLLYIDELDYGDAYDGGVAGGGYPTLLIQDGARHAVVPGVHLGWAVDTEPDGQPSVSADGDDSNLLYPGIPFPPGDEDGVIMPPVFIAGSTVTVQVLASTDGFLNTWVDWNMNGSWADAGEHVFVDLPIAMGVNNLDIVVPLPPATVWGGPHTRWRFTTYAPTMQTFTGLERDGEVEDHEILVDVLDFGDAPSPYPTLLVDDGARHRMPSDYWLGASPPDAEPDGQPDAHALGDDHAGTADEDGVSVGQILRGADAAFTVVASTNTGVLNAWLDLYGTGSWDAGDQIATDIPLATGPNVLTVAIPANARVGPTFARFRYSSSSFSGLQPTGYAGDGEVEDYMFIIEQEGPGSDIVITNMIYDIGATNITIEWSWESNVTYEAQYTDERITLSNQVWTGWGGYIDTEPYQQTDTNPSNTTKFYRVIAPYTAP